MDKIRVLELFSGTHSIGKECEKRGWQVYSLDRDLPNYDKLDKDKTYKSFKHFQEDIMTWDYKQYTEGYFNLITASPVCLYWSALRRTWIGRKMKNKDTGKLNEQPFTREDIENDINKYGKPMVDKIFEIINYYNPQYWWVENPKSSSMKKYITDKPFYDVDYCQYCLWGYKKPTRFWTNIKGFIPKRCNKKCPNIIVIATQKGDMHTGYKKLIKSGTRKLHKSNIGGSSKIKSIKQYLHKERMGTSKTIRTKEGIIIRCNTKALREKYKDYENIQTKEGKIRKNYYGNHTNRLKRYRIPPNLINDLLDCMNLSTPLLTNLINANICYESSDQSIMNYDKLTKKQKKVLVA